jgi:O-antigen/teichoic acid export membrane protein
MLGNTLKILRGTVAAQVVGFIALPLLTRLFTPESFGLFQLFQAAMGLLLVTAAMRYEIALLRAAEGRELAATLVLCGLINVAVSLLVALGCAVAASGPFDLSPQARKLLWWLPVGVLAGGALQTLGYLALRHKAFTLVASAKVAQALGTVAASIGIGLVAPVSTGLVIGDLLGRLASAAVIGTCRALVGAADLVRCTATDLASAARRFSEFPIVSVPGGLINAAGGTLTSLMMFAAFDAATAGQYGLVERSIILPMGMVAGAVSQVFTADLSACLRDGSKRALALYRGVIWRMFLLGLGPAVAVGLFAPPVFGWLFGPAWAQAGEFARIMSPLILVGLVTTSVNMAIMIAGYQKVQFAWEVLRLVTMLVAWLALTHFGVPACWAVAAHVLVIVLTSGLYLLLADHMLRRPMPTGDSSAS